MEQPSPELASSAWVYITLSVASKSKSIISSHSRHFLSLSVLFLLPLSLLLLLLLLPLAFLPRPSNPPPSLLRRHHHLHHHPSSFSPLPLLYLSAAFLLLLSAASSISHSARRAFFGKPVHLLPSLLSLPSSLLRLLATFLAADLVLSALLILPVSLLLLSLRSLSFLDLQRFSLPLCSAFAVGYLVLLVFLLARWALAGVVAVVEGSWGFEPLWRSEGLVKGMRHVVLLLFLSLAAGVGVMLWAANLGENDVLVTDADWHVVVPAVVRIVCATVAMVVLLLYGIVKTVVLYMYCKAMHGELAAEVAEEFAGEYVCLPSDDMKFPRLGSVVHC